MSTFEHGHGRLNLEGSLIGKNKVVKPRGAKENVRQGLKIRKATKEKTISHPVLIEWFDNVTSQLNSIATCPNLDHSGSAKFVVNQSGGLKVVLSDGNRSVVRHMKSNNVIDRHDQSLALDQ
ncbi:hypothetical protein V6N11_035456 [Hibiscus sabdariffa]|uniref:Uncharacterized protein n=1 Tax=Hibiscus sabdariffa TaxID=183260 RepID=A0ABR2R0E6_9ROSI